MVHRSHRAPHPIVRPSVASSLVRYVLERTVSPGRATGGDTWSDGWTRVLARVVLRAPSTLGLVAMLVGYRICGLDRIAF